MTASGPPPVDLRIERTDPAAVDRALSTAEGVKRFAVTSVGQRKVSKAMKEGCLIWKK
jgi:hypothetical protein